MGGIIIIVAILIPCLLLGKLDNIYMILMLITTVWLGTLGFLDDYIKVFRKDKEGLHGKFKIIGQVGLGLIVGLTLYLSPNVVIRENVEIQKGGEIVEIVHKAQNEKSTKTTIPFFKNNNLDYADFVGFLGAENDVIISVGRGAKDVIDDIKKYAEENGFGFGASRPVVDMEKAKYENQVGLTGKNVNPKVYVAIGIEGLVQHTCAIQKAGCIIAVNPNKDAKIFDFCDYGIISTAEEFLEYM